MSDNQKELAYGGIEDDEIVYPVACFFLGCPSLAPLPEWSENANFEADS